VIRYLVRYLPGRPNLRVGVLIKQHLLRVAVAVGVTTSRKEEEYVATDGGSAYQTETVDLILVAPLVFANYRT
jgi:hypothetical protein